MAQHIPCKRCGREHEDTLGDAICVDCRKPDEFPDYMRNDVIIHQYLDSGTPKKQTDIYYNGNEILFKVVNSISTPTIGTYLISKNFTYLVSRIYFDPKTITNHIHLNLMGKYK